MVHTKQTNLTAAAGAEIGLELGVQFISAYRTTNPTDVLAYYVGRNILDQVLAQPGCVGIKFYNAYDDAGQKTLVYVGVNATGADMLSVTAVNTEGQLDVRKGIVADRAVIIKGGGIEGGEETEWWEF